MKLSKSQARMRRHRRVRQIVAGTSERPRICVFRSNRHVSAQLIDDSTGKTLAAVTTVSKEKRGKNSCNCAAAEKIGKNLGEKMKSLGVVSAVFDRNGYIYHGVVKSLASAVRSIDEENHFHF